MYTIYGAVHTPIQLVARLLTTTIVILVGSDWHDWLNESQLSKVMAILVADCFTSPLLRLVNPAGLIKRYVLLKRARTQAAANALMEGTIWNIGEQYKQ
jgi:hypothetical protein